MSFQAYIDTIYAKTGKKPEEFRALASSKGLLEPGVKPMQIVDWLKQDFDLGRGHAMALIVTFNQATHPARSQDEQIAERFEGQKAHWRASFDTLLSRVQDFGPDVSVKAGGSYISLLRGGAKFSIIQPTSNRLDIGIKDKSAPTTGRFEMAGTWNAMVTHRVRLTEPDQIDAQLMQRLRAAYDQA
jgi:hypothetical protein